VTQRSSILGVAVSAVNVQMVLEVIDEWIHSGESQYVCVTGVHGVIESYRKVAVRQIHNAAGLVVPDGMPLVWLSRLRGFRHVDRVYGPDLMLALCERSLEHGYRNFFYGGAPGVAERLADRLQSRFQGLQIVGSYSPPFRALRPEEDDEISEAINRVRPDIVWVGMSTPKQETWMAQHVDRLRTSVLIGVGAAFDFHAGLKRQAPRWMMRAGLEWLFRLSHEPLRLAPRYLINNPMFLWLIALQMAGAQFQGVEDSVSYSHGSGKP
jgi:N-acetylglucosaminyldiphosphoundecaprenol N-acetyl-beta-D-mannosaminyltransferase